MMEPRYRLQPAGAKDGQACPPPSPSLNPHSPPFDIKEDVGACSCSQCFAGSARRPHATTPAQRCGPRFLPNGCEAFQCDFWPEIPANCFSMDMPAPDLQMKARPTTKQAERFASWRSPLNAALWYPVLWYVVITVHAKATKRRAVRCFPDPRHAYLYPLRRSGSRPPSGATLYNPKRGPVTQPRPSVLVGSAARELWSPTLVSASRTYPMPRSLEA